ncbi:hypothetical protein SK128_007494 [Halocaridina rubra]|uniref:Uncharacterized protein n=1 Tax=Halocaridina rubra TaxID=373956 RepID=A0AAN8WPW9_HALRR
MSAVPEVGPPEDLLHTYKPGEVASAQVVVDASKVKPSEDLTAPMLGQWASAHTPCVTAAQVVVVATLKDLTPSVDYCPEDENKEMVLDVKSV